MPPWSYLCLNSRRDAISLRTLSVKFLIEHLLEYSLLQAALAGSQLAHLGKERSDFLRERLTELVQILRGVSVNLLVVVTT